MNFLIFLCFSLFYVKLTLTDEITQSQWQLFKSNFSKQYDNKEEFRRYEIFKHNFKRIIAHNKKYDNGHSPYYQGINKFADKTFDEYIQDIFGHAANYTYRVNAIENEKIENFNTSRPIQTKYEFDWTEKGGITDIKDQGTCGSCYAFSAIGALESAHWRLTGKLVKLSEQHVIDCSLKRKYNSGCNGGDPQRALEYIRDFNGVYTEASYPYEGRDGSCRIKPESLVAKVRSVERLIIGDEDAMKSAIENSGPLTASIDAAFPSMQFYAGGVFYEPKCNEEYEINHSLLIVGYGTQNGNDFWKIKNSFGTNWGDKGYILWARNKDNHCGIAADVVSVTAADGTIIFNQKFIMFNIFLLTSINLMKFMF